MIFGNLKNPFKKNPSSDNQEKFEYDFQTTMNFICEKEIINPKEATIAYLNLLNTRKFSKQEELRKIVFHLAACYDRIDDLGRALYYLAFCPYFCTEGNLPQKKPDRLKTYRAIMLHKAFKEFSRNKRKIRIIVVDPQISRLNYYINTIETTCFQTVFATECKEHFDSIKTTAFIQEYDLILLSSDLFVTIDEMKNEYSRLKSLAYSPFLSFMISEEMVQDIYHNHPGLQYFIVNDDILFLYSIIMIILQKED